MTENHEAEMNKLNETEIEQVTKTDTELNPMTMNEFKITVRKLEMPVRPRGVLAE